MRADKVRKALVWLKAHNPLYADIEINHDVLNQLPANDMLPFHIEHVRPPRDGDALTSHYDMAPPPTESDCSNTDVAFQKLIITDVDGHASSNELRAAALRHIEKKSGGYMSIPHDPKPENEFVNPKLFPKIYPSLFPYGLGGFEHPCRREKLSMKRHVKHLLNLADRRFQEHPTFLFTAFNVLQRRTLLLHTSLKMKRKVFASSANTFATLSPDVIHRVLERVI